MGSAKRKDGLKPRSKQVAGTGAARAAAAHIDVGTRKAGTARPRPRRHRASAPEDFKTSLLQIRVKDELKTQAAVTLERLGISLAEAVRVFLGRVVSENAFPFPLHVPNEETAAALRDSMAADHTRDSEHQRYADVEEMFDDLEKGGVR